MPTQFDQLATEIRAQLLNTHLLIVIGSAKFWHPDSEPTCEEIGRELAELSDLALVTGGVGGAGATVGKSYFRSRRQQNREPFVFHVLPQDSRPPNYGHTFVAGETMAERREVLARLGSLYLVIEGGPGTEHEARVAMDQGAVLIPVGRSGGVAETIYAEAARPIWADATAWAELGKELSEARQVAKAAVRLVQQALEGHA